MHLICDGHHIFCRRWKFRILLCLKIFSRIKYASIIVRKVISKVISPWHFVLFRHILSPNNIYIGTAIALVKAEYYWFWSIRIWRWQLPNRSGCRAQYGTEILHPNQASRWLAVLRPKGWVSPWTEPWTFVVTRQTHQYSHKGVKYFIGKKDGVQWWLGNG